MLKFTSKPFKLFFLLLAILLANNARSQDNMRFIKMVRNEHDIKIVYDSLKTPILIAGSSAYAINSDCIDDMLKAKDKLRNRGSGSEDRPVVAEKIRNNGSGSEERQVPVEKTRNSGSGSEDRPVVAEKTRNSGSGSEERQVPVEKTRNSGSGMGERAAVYNDLSFTCATDDSGTLILYLSKKQKKQIIKIYYNTSFLNKEQYKIKTL